MRLIVFYCVRVSAEKTGSAKIALCEFSNGLNGHNYYMMAKEKEQEDVDTYSIRVIIRAKGEPTCFRLKEDERELCVSCCD